MQATSLVSQGLKIDNTFGQIERIPIESEDFSLSDPEGMSQRIKTALEYSVVATTISPDKEQQIENIFYSKEPLIKERDAILNNIFKYYNPFYRKKLKKLDADLDELDLQLYLLQSNTKQIETDLDRAIESAKEKFKNL